MCAYVVPVIAASSPCEHCVTISTTERPTEMATKYSTTLWSKVVFMCKAFKPFGVRKR
jgi:hypothetical protein